MPTHDTEPAINTLTHVWKPGDIALCIDDKPQVRPDQMQIIPRVKVGCAYRVFEIYIGTGGYMLTLDGGERYLASRFIPVTPMNPTPDDINIITAYRLGYVAWQFGHPRPTFGKYLPPPRSHSKKGGPNNEPA